MNGWDGFWIALALWDIGYMWHSIEKKKMQKKGFFFRWWE